MKSFRKLLALLLALLFAFTGSAFAADEPAAPETSEEPAAPETPEEPAAPETPEEPAAPKKRIALTFDDGPDTVMTAPVLDVLEKYGIPATFFLCGNKINEKTAPLVERALSLGCEIGCHGWDHRNMTQVSKEMTVKQVGKFRAAVEEYIHVSVSVMLVRPPGGHSNAKVRLAASEVDMAIILWDVDSADWTNPGPEKIAKNVRSKAQDGSIVLMHDRHRPTVDALEILIPQLLEDGYEFVTVSELITGSGDTVEPGREYRSAHPA